MRYRVKVMSFYIVYCTTFRAVPNTNSVLGRVGSSTAPDQDLYSKQLVPRRSLRPMPTES